MLLIGILVSDGEVLSLNFLGRGQWRDGRRGCNGGDKGIVNKNFRMYPYIFGVSIHYLLSPLDHGGA